MLRCARLKSRLKACHIAIGVGILLSGLPLNAAQIVPAELQAKFEQQYPIPVSPSSDLNQILLKSRTGSTFTLALLDALSGHVQTINQSSQTQLALTWNPAGTGLAWLEPVKSGCGFELKFFNRVTGTLTNLPSPKIETAAAPLRFSPNGKRIAFVAGTQLAITTINGKTNGTEFWATGIHGGSDFVWIGNAMIALSPNDGKRSLEIVTKTELTPAAALLPGTLLKSLAWSESQQTLLASVRQPSSNFDSILSFNGQQLKSRTQQVPLELSRHPTGNALRPTWIPGGRKFAYILQSADAQQIRINDGKSPVSKLLTEVEGEFEISGATPKKIMVIRSSSESPPTIELFSLTKENQAVPPRVIAIPRQRDRFPLGITPTSLALRSSGNQEFFIQHWAAREGPNRKAIVWIHGGPNLRESIKWNAEIQEALALGIDFVQVNYRGSSGYGQDFENAGDDNERLNDIEATVRHLEQHRNILPHKIVVVGSSYGGYLAARFAASEKVSLRGVVLMSPGTFTIPPQQKFHPPQKSPTMVVFQGANDCIIPLDLGMRVLSSIFGPVIMQRPENKPKIFLNEGHHFHRTTSRAEVWAATFNLFNES